MADTVDVLIVGAGASGAAAAWSLAETRMRIVCLEQGDWMNPLQYPSSGRDWEARGFGDMSISPNRRKRDTDYPVNDANSPISVANFNAVGGSTILYAGHFPRFHPSDFRVKTLDGVADDWPIDYQTLEPYYAENDRMMGTSGLAGDPAYPPKEAMMPPVPMGKSGRALAKGFNQLGWHWWPSDTAIATQPYDGRAGCINLGACGSGCAQGAKASTDVTYWPHAVRAGVEVRTRCRVREIAVNGDGMASGVVYYDRDGVERCPGRRGGDRRLQRRRHAAPAAELGFRQVPERPRQPLRPRRQESDVPSLRLDPGRIRRADGRLQRPRRVHLEPGVLRNERRARLRSRLHLRDPPRPRPGGDGAHRHVQRAHPLGRRPSRRVPAALQPHRRHGGHLRGPAGRTQHRDAGCRVEGRARHPGAEGRLHALREQPPNARPRGGARPRGAAGGRRHGRHHRSAHRRRRPGI